MRVALWERVALGAALDPGHQSDTQRLALARQLRAAADLGRGREPARTWPCATGDDEADSPPGLAHGIQDTWTSSTRLAGPS